MRAANDVSESVKKRHEYGEHYLKWNGSYWQ